MRHSALPLPDGLPLRQGDKLGVYTFKNLWPVPSLRGLQSIGGACWVYPGPIVMPGESWTQELGNEFAETFEHGSFSIMTRRRAKQPMVIDGESHALIDEARQIARGVRLHGRLDFAASAFLGGDWQDGRAEIRSVGREDRDLLPFGARRRVVGERVIAGAVKIARTLRSLEGQEDPARMGRGYFAMTRALKEQNFEERLSLLVRAIEGLLYLEAGQGAEAFARRAAFFGGDGSEPLLRELYRMRGKVAHAQSWSSAMGHHSHDTRNAIGERRLRQADALACEIYCKVLASPRVCQHFASDPKQAAFWKLNESERRRIWGKPIQIMRVR